MSWWEQEPLAPQAPAVPLLGTERIGTTGEGRAIIQNPDGSHSSERSITVGIDGQYVNIPSMFGGKEVSEDEAVNIMRQNGWKDPETGRQSQFYPSLDAALAAAKERSQNIPTQGGNWWDKEPLAQDKTQTGHAVGDPQAAGAAGAVAGGQTSPGEDGSVWGDVNAVVNRLGTQFTKGITGLAGLPEASLHGLQAAGDWTSKQLLSEDQWRRVQEKRAQWEAERQTSGKTTLQDAVFPQWKALPSTQGMNNLVFNRFEVPEVNGQTIPGKILDVGLQSMAGGASTAPRLAFPGFTGGLLSETAGQIADAAEAPGWLRFASRFGGGLVGSWAGVGVQQVGNSAAQGGRNALSGTAAGDSWIGRNVLRVPSADATAGKIMARAMQRDGTDPQALAAALRQHGDAGATLADVGGNSMRRTVRAAAGSPGPAGSIADDFFSARRTGEGERVAAAIDANVSGQHGFASTIDDIVAQRSAKAAPLYEAAGIPRDPSQYAQAPLLASQEVKDLIAKSHDIRRVIAQAKGLPQYAGLKDNSIVLLDKAYKNLGGKAEAAKRAGDMALYRDLAEQRNMLKAAIVGERPEYGAALKAFADDSALKDAIESGRKMFRGATDPEVIAKHYARLPADEKELFRQGVAEHLRTIAERTATGSEAKRVFGGPAMQQKLRIVMGDDYEAFSTAMNREATFNRTMRDVGGGSRTTPMAEDIADLRQQTSVWQDVLEGNPVRAATRVAGGAIDRFATGRNERVNEALVRALLNPDSAAQRRTLEAIEQAKRAQQLANMLRRQSYVLGPTIPAYMGAAQPGQ